MPRPNPPRPLGCEANLARRVAYERTHRGWTYEGLARRMSDAGCPIQASAIYKIEKGNPPRRISVDELVAFATAFDIDIKDLLIPPEEAAVREAQELFTKLTDALHRSGMHVTEVTDWPQLLLDHGSSPTPPKEGS